MSDLIESENTGGMAQAFDGKREVVPVTPMAMLQVAMKEGAGLEQMQKLMDLQERWEANEARKAYVQAMSKFRAECPAITKTKKAHNSMYAGLAETIDEIKDLLSECGLSHSWKTEQSEGITTVTCCVTHVQGHQECTSLSAGADNSGSKNAIQAIASTITYLERYTLFAILGLASKEMDNDGGAPVELITEEMVNLLDSKLVEHEIDRKKFNSWLKRDLKVDSLEQVSMKAYKRVDEAISRAIKAKNKDAK